MNAYAPQPVTALYEQLLDELSRISTRKDFAPEDFFQLFLAKSLPIVSAGSGRVWGLNPRSQMVQVCEQGTNAGTGNGANIGNDRVSPRSKNHSRYLYDVLKSGRIVFADVDEQMQGWVSGQTKSVLLIPLMLKKAGVGVLEYHLTDALPADQQTELKSLFAPLLQQISTYLARQHEERVLESRPFPHEQLEKFIAAVHVDDSSQHVAMTTVNEGRLLFHCDRVSLATRRDKAANIIAISGQQSVVSKSNLVQGIRGIVELVLASGRQIEFDGSLESYPPRVEEAIVQYLRESGAQSFVAVPLFPPARTTDDDSIEAGGSDRTETRPFAVLFVEQLSPETAPLDLKLIDRTSGHVAQALYHALEHERVFLLPVRRAIGRVLGPGSKSVRKKLTWLCVACVVAIAGLILIPFPLSVPATGTIVPTEQLKSYAPTDAEVLEVFVTGGERVSQGQPLLRLHSDELSTRMLLLQNQLNEKLQTMSALEAEQAQPVSRDDEIRLQGKISKTTVEIRGLRSRLKTLESEASMLLVRSKISGTVATFEPENLLVGRPVRRGQLLMEVINQAGPWHLALDIPAHKLGHVHDASSAEGAGQLPVNFMLATMPEKKFAGQIEKLSTRTTEKSDGSHVLKAVATFDRSWIAGNETAGAEVQAKIDCGTSTLGHVLFGDLIDAARRTIW